MHCFTATQARNDGSQRRVSTTSEHMLVGFVIISQVTVTLVVARGDQDPWTPWLATPPVSAYTVSPNF